ncbi:MAG: hypothetical protein QM763_24420 [Agriterribacter sp.]
MGLFQIIDKSGDGDPELIEEKFRKKFSGKSYTNAVQYLMNTLSDVLVLLRAKNDKWFLQYFALMRAKLLFDRSLPEDGYKELEKAQKISWEIQDLQVHSIACRLQLNHLSEKGFKEMSEQELIQLQMKPKSSLELSRQIQEHYSLYELLKYRLIHSGEALSENDKKKLSDLVISELSLITRGKQHNFESEKLHMLFQSFYFINIGDYRSALKIFERLNQLFEENRQTWGSPPYDYLSFLEGILNSLRTIGYFDEMDYYINKIQVLYIEKYTEHFQLIADQVAAIYRLNVLISRKEFNEAVQFIKTINPSLLKKTRAAHEEKLPELLLYVGLTFFCKNDLGQANKYISMALSGVRRSSPLYRASRLIYVLIHYKMNNIEFLDYEIMSYKRSVNKTGGILKIEQLVFKMLKFDPKRNSVTKKRLFYKQILSSLDSIEKDKYEWQVLKYYDFTKLLRDEFFK